MYYRVIVIILVISNLACNVILTLDLILYINAEIFYRYTIRYIISVCDRLFHSYIISRDIPRPRTSHRYIILRNISRSKTSHRYIILRDILYRGTFHRYIISRNISIKAWQKKYLTNILCQPVIWLIKNSIYRFIPRVGWEAHNSYQLISFRSLNITNLISVNYL